MPLAYSSGITQHKVSDMMRGDFSNLSERKLMDCLTRLGYEVPAASELPNANPPWRLTA
ncbi:MAG: hypothetical protein EXR27_23025 [Betaproteobacteria bacterium]|nr:hypothetical protein [Betaproteobacteria bacterium]